MTFKTFCYTAENYAEIMGIDMDELFEHYGRNTTHIAIVEMVDSEGFQIGKLTAKYTGPNTFAQLTHALIMDYM